MHPPLIKGSNTCTVWPTVISSRSDSKVASFLNNPEAAGRESPDLRVKESYQLSLQSLEIAILNYMSVMLYIVVCL